MELHPGLVSAFLKIFEDRFKNTTTPREVAAALMAEILNSAVEGCEASLKAEQADDALVPKSVELLANMLDQFREGLFDEAHFSQVRLTGLPSKLTLTTT